MKPLCVPGQWLGWLLTVLCLAVAAPAPAAARDWWVYLAPEEARQLYRSPGFTALKAEVDSKILGGVQAPKTCLSTNSPWVQQIGDAQEELSAVYLALKWGKYGGTDAVGLVPYRARIAKNWQDILAAGPLDLWSDDFEGITHRKLPSNCDPDKPYKPGWYEGDIALRFWIFGALPSYDAVRDDLPANDRQAIDTWLRGLAGKLWNGRDFPLNINRGVSASAQAHIIALLLQDRPLFESYYRSPEAGLRDFYRQLDYAPKLGCNFPSLPGLSHELSYRDAAHGNQTVIHGFSALAIIAHASRFGGPPDWTPLKPTDPARLAATLDTWYTIAGPLRAQFVSYAQCLEKSAAKPIFRPTGLNLRLWAPFAFFQARFLDIAVREGGEKPALWQQRARSFLQAGGGFQLPDAKSQQRSTVGGAPG